MRYKRLINIILVLWLSLCLSPFAIAQTTPVASEPQLLIFISSSMPAQSIRQWLGQVQQTKASIIMRGLIHNSFRETTVWLSQYLSDNPNELQAGIQIDPILFQHYNITHVPTVVLLQGEGYTKITGDVPLKEALKVMQES